WPPSPPPCIPCRPRRCRRAASGPGGRALVSPPTPSSACSSRACGSSSGAWPPWGSGGESCPAVVAASRVLVAAMFTFTLVLLFGVVPLMARAAGPGPAAADDIEAAKVQDQAPAPKRLAAAAWVALC
ncbi:unnamed protein product, partial [Urochloa humidicola]